MPSLWAVGFTNSSLSETPLWHQAVAELAARLNVCLGPESKQQSPLGSRDLLYDFFA